MPQEDAESKFPATVAIKVYAWTPPRSTNKDVLDMIKNEAKEGSGLLFKKDMTLPKDKYWPNCTVAQHYRGSKIGNHWTDDLVLPNKVLLAVDVDGQVIHAEVLVSTASRAATFSSTRFLTLKSTNEKLKVCLCLRTDDTLEGCYVVRSMSVDVYA